MRRRPPPTPLGLARKAEQERIRQLAAHWTIPYCEAILREAPYAVERLYDQVLADIRKQQGVNMKHIVTAKANHGAKKGKMTSVIFKPATEGGGGTVICDNDGDEPGGYCPPTSSVHESVESAHAKMGEHMGVKVPKGKMPVKA